MASIPTQQHSQYPSLYRATVEDAAAGGADLMGKLVSVAIKALYARELTARSARERDGLILAGKLLQSKDAQLRELYPKALLAAFLNPEQSHKKAEPLTLEKVQFDQLELMDEGQVQESVAVARAQQVAMLAADASLAELNTLICAAMGLKSVRPESNPLRPEVYVKALKQVVEQLSIPNETRLEWLASMSVTLGAELHLLYRILANKLQGQGVVAVGYARVQAPLSAGVGRPGSVSLQDLPNVSNLINAPHVPHVPYVPNTAARSTAPDAPPRPRELDASLLTLDSLRRLLSGELEQQVAGNRVEAFAQQFARQFEGGNTQAVAPVSEFASTVPAAFEALEEMKQVGQVVQRLQERHEGAQGTDSGVDSSVAGIRDMLRRSATGVGQALSLEVVTLMVDNIVRNPRLLEPIQRLIADLEPALLLLSLVDPRFFTDKQHPARELLQEITHRSMAFESTQSPGFGGFIKDLQQAVEPLGSADIENAEPFEQVLGQLRAAWTLAANAKERTRAAAVNALQHAEQRNLLAEKIARQIDSHPDSMRVPEVVIDFLCGPWAQVVAQARIEGGSGSKTADKYQALISAMLWSAHPDLNRKNIAKLTKLVPLLLATVRDGLDTIHYPVSKTTVFLEALMGLHQMAFRAAAKPLEKAPEPASAPRKLGPRLHVVEDGDPWVAPEEAQASNFIAFETPAADPLTAPVAAIAQADAVDGDDGESDLVLDDLPLGSWIELFSNEHWVRTQLTWASPHGTLFLFTSAFGTSQSMTRRSRDKLLAAGHLRLVSGQPVVDGALDAVAQIAMRNSVDTTY